ncbi:MAG: patatin-like phospholipase family protein [Bacteroidia bacterium]|jgi:NTE family protein|nr:patatin-like phospholipase family protein [Bacteroidia bacterium]
MKIFSCFYSRLLWCFIAFPILCFPQRPKVGLVLSGGGAKGISHIGILQAIDSAGLKIDFLTGTSMGSVMGSLYSVGYTGKQIEKEVDKLDWGVLLSNKPSYTDISIDEKDEYGKYSAEVGMKGLKPKIATGLIESEELWLKLNELLLPVYNVKDFSKFNIPFKCISTDLSTGKAVVHSKGEIVKAVRASMAIPSVFTAIDVDTTKLVDGGIIRNFPVTDIKKMGADIVIGVNLFPGLPDVSKLNTALDVFYQITQYRDAEDLIKEKKLCNVIIEPPVDQYSAGSFGASDDIMRIGKEVGNLYYPYFKRLADSLNRLYPINYDPEKRLPAIQNIVIDEMEFVGIKNTSKDLLMDKIDIQTGKSYTAEQINRGFRRAYSSRYYDNIYYELIPTEPGHARLKCIVKETMLTQAKVGLSFHTYSGPAILANVTVRNLLLDKSRTMFKIAAGEYLRVLVQHRQAFGRKANDYINIEYLNENLPWNIYEGASKEYLYNLRFTRLDLNYTHVFGSDLSLTFGTNYQQNHFYPDVSAVNKIDGSNNYLYSYLKLENNTTNRLHFPNSGRLMRFETGVVYNRNADILVYNNAGQQADFSFIIDGKPEFYRARFDYLEYIPLHKKLTFFYNVNLGLTYHSQGFDFDNFFIGGIQPLFRQQMVFAGLNEGQITSRSALIGQIGLQYQVIGDVFVMARANSLFYDFSTYDEIYVQDNTKVLNGFSLGLGYNLGVMPMEFTAMYAPELGMIYKHIKIGFLF